ncbi:TolC family protein [Pseudoduganella sp. LjRoot289]|uniref:TolC family protein n=1 Tax=Pseudoduganella sp. LjRoot289 TaxID=3342314 RepID=UPI003ECFDC53
MALTPLKTVPSALAALLLSACSLAPVYERPALPVADGWPAAVYPAATASAAGDAGAADAAGAARAAGAADAAGVAAAGATAAHDIRWQDFFRDERLKQAIGLALEHNRDLRVAILNIERARSLYQVQASDRLPTVNAGLSGARQRVPDQVAPGGRGGVSSSFSSGLGVTAFELDLFGRVRNLSEAALERFLATEEARRSAQISLVAEVAAIYEALAADVRLLALSGQTLASRTESHRRQVQLREQGASSEFDLRQSESLLEAANIALQQAIRQRALDRNALAVLVGRELPAEALPAGLLSTGALAAVAPPAGPVPATAVSAPPAMPSEARPSLAAPLAASAAAGAPAGQGMEPAAQRTRDAMAELPAGLPSGLLTARPDIRRQEALLRASNANIGAARAAFFPRIALTGAFGTASDELSGLFGSGTRAWSFLPQISLPIFDGGRNRANLGVAQADRDIAVAQYDKAIQVAFREVADALAGRATLAEELRAARAQENAEQVRHDLARLRYEGGQASYLEYLDAQRSLFAARQQSIRTGLAETQNRIALYKALGGGWAASQP